MSESVRLPEYSTISEERVYMTVWASLGMDSYLSERKIHGRFIPISDRDRAILKAALESAILDDEDCDPQHYLERLEATHFYMFVTEPDGEHGVDYNDESTWWDFSSVLAKQTCESRWEVWSEDPGDEGNIWYQSCYTKSEAFAVRDFHMEWADRGELYNEVSESHPYITNAVYEACKSIMPDWT